MSPSPPNTTITLFVDPTLKGRAMNDGEVYRHGAWVALIRRDDSDVIRRRVFLDAVTRDEAEAEVKRHLEITRRRLAWEPRGSAWITHTRLTRD